MAWLDQLVEYARSLMTERVVEALNVRGCSDEQIREYNIGYLKRTLPPLDYDPKFLKQYGSGTVLDDVFVYPLTNALGEIRGVQFRPVDRSRKFNSNFMLDTGEPILFGLGQAMPHIWATESVTLVEGANDLFPVQRHSPAVVATMTARVVGPFLATLRRTCKRIVLAYDNDTTGQKAAASFYKEHGREYQIEGIRWAKLPMPNGKMTKDPGDLWELRGEEYLGKFIREGVEPFNRLMERNDG
jgi:DNA primase